MFSTVFLCVKPTFRTPYSNRPSMYKYNFTCKEFSDFQKADKYFKSIFAHCKYNQYISTEVVWQSSRRIYMQIPASLARMLFAHSLSSISHLELETLCASHKKIIKF